MKRRAYELLFFALYANPFFVRLTEGRAPDPAANFGETLRELPKVEMALRQYRARRLRRAVIRMLILMARSRGQCGNPGWRDRIRSCNPPNRSTAWAKMFGRRSSMSNADHRLRIRRGDPPRCQGDCRARRSASERSS